MRNYWKHIDDFFREKLGRYRETPPPDVWEALDKQLDGLIPSATAPRPSFRWLGHVAMVALVAAISVPLVRKMTASKSAVAKSELVAAKPEANPGISANASVANTAGSAIGEPGKEIVAGPEQNGQQSIADNAVVVNSTGGQSTVGGSKSGTEATAKQPRTPGLGRHHSSDAGKRKHDARVADARGAVGRDSKTKSRHATDHVAENNYGSNTGSNVNSAAVSEEQAGQLAKQTQPVPKPARKTDLKKSVGKKQQIIPVAASFNKLEVGLKAGFEQGFNSDAAGKYVLSPYLQYSISQKLALMVQPAVKYAQLRSRNVGFSETYYSVNNDGKTVQDGDPVQTGVQGGTGVYTTKYTYSETHDLITKSYTTGGKYMEMELPLLLKYKIAKQLSMYVGVNAVYQKFGVTEHTSTQHGLVSSTDFNEVTVGLPTTLPIGGDINYAATPFSSYKGPAYPSPKDQVNIGYMFGLSYEYRSRWLLDALLEQTPTRVNMADGYNINSSLSAPQFRLSAGYRFIK